MANQYSMAQSKVAQRYWRHPAIVILAAFVTLTALTGEVAAKQARKPANVEATAPREAGDPIMAIVSIKSQRVTFYDAEGWIYRAPVSTGIKGRETPAGVFALLEKDKDHHSSLYDDAWMPNMQRITWNGVALHGGPLPGYAASHGCVRMPYDFAEKLFDKTDIGMRVIIAPNDAEPVDFSHPALFVPNADAIKAAPGRVQTASRDAEDAAKAADDAKKAAVTTARESTALTASLRRLEQAKTRADAELKFADRTLAAAKTDEAKAKAEELQQKATTKVTDSASQLETAKTDAKAKTDAAAAAKEAVKAAEAKKVETAKAAIQAKLALEPVSVYISRATQKIYVRRNTHKAWPDGGEVFDSSIEAPVTIRDPDKPIGTHIFTAVARDGAGLRWTEVTIDEGDNAKDALDRITIPQDVLDRIAPTAAPRSSIIVSDEPLSTETNYRTEFVAVLSNQPQGGFITRKPSEVRVARRDNPDDDGGFFSSFQRSWGPQPAPQQRGWDDSQRSWDPQNGFGWNQQPSPPPQNGNPRRRGGQTYRQVQQPVQQQGGWFQPSW
ncbi:L,D-transpeptidase [Bradyrhizobium genosp. L]|uniref:L,D-transpeptidase n=1 Tax=Bradyrhizobium genosp. L TaxID=83637 RepID=UPI0018A308DB|nr:L,D-transpeptidase [Bradyrhizobium genosp. L]QPF86662.1 L,D-transpeptidase [Bradyrhizobium genosp. L]